MFLIALNRIAAKHREEKEKKDKDKEEIKIKEEPKEMLNVKMNHTTSERFRYPEIKPHIKEVIFNYMLFKK